MYRSEKDLLGQRDVVHERYYGIQTQRSLDCMSVSGHSIADMPELIRSLAMVKKAAALTNEAVGHLTSPKAQVIVQVCDEIIAGLWSDEFVVDPYQGGAGTSTNMNINEVIANRGLELLGCTRGDYAKLHPLNDVNQSQSTNDSYATAVRMSVYYGNMRLVRTLNALGNAFQEKANQVGGIEKLGRTQLQDAVPMSVSEELHAYGATIAEDVHQAEVVGKLFLEVNLGGTAIGSGLGASNGYAKLIIQKLSQVASLDFKRSRSLYEASWDMGAFVLYSGMLKRIAAKLSKICNDLRLLSSGPYGGLGEYKLPACQAGSSIMPGKVNPVIPEMMNQICFKTFGADSTITYAAESGQLQLNATEPLIAWTLSETVELLIRGIESLRVNCVDGIEIDQQRCRDTLEQSTALATCLVKHIGYDRAGELAHDAMAKQLNFRDYIVRFHPDLGPFLSTESL